MQISVSKVRIKHYQSTNLILIRRNKKLHIGLKPRSMKERVKIVTVRADEMTVSPFEIANRYG